MATPHLPSSRARRPSPWWSASALSVLVHVGVALVWQLTPRNDVSPAPAPSDEVAEDGSAAAAPPDEEASAAMPEPPEEFRVVTLVEPRVARPERAPRPEEARPPAAPEREREAPAPLPTPPELAVVTPPPPPPPPPEPEPAVEEPPREESPTPAPEPPSMDQRVAIDQVESNNIEVPDATRIADQANQVEVETIAEQTTLFDESAITQQAGDAQRVPAEPAGEPEPETAAADAATIAANAVAGTVEAAGDPGAESQEPAPAQAAAQSETPPQTGDGAEQDQVAMAEIPAERASTPSLVPAPETPSAEPMPTEEHGTVAQPPEPVGDFEAFSLAAAGQRAAEARQAGDPSSLFVTPVVANGDPAFDAVFGERLGRDRERVRREVARASLPGDHEGQWERTRGTLENFDVHVATGSETHLNASSSPSAGYIHHLHNSIHPWWTGYLARLSLSEGAGSPLSDRSLQCELEWVIDRDGGVSDVRIVQQAREPMFTAEAVNMLYALGPFEPPPPGMLSSDGNAYIRWRFQRDERQCGTFGASIRFLDSSEGHDEG